MTVYELIQELASYDATQEVEIEVEVLPFDIECPHCKEWTENEKHTVYARADNVVSKHNDPIITCEIEVELDT